MPRAVKKASLIAPLGSLPANPTVEDLQKQLALYKRQEAALRARDCFPTYLRLMHPDPEAPDDVDRSSYDMTPFHLYMARALEQVVKKEIQFLILEMPPRHGKTVQTSKLLPSWIMGKFPLWDGIVATYSDDFAMDFGRAVRNVVHSPQFKQVFPGFMLSRGGAASDRLAVAQGGQWSFAGPGGALTGRGAHILICDDLIKNFQEARSDAVREAIWHWFTRVAMTRRMGPKLVIMTFTRWHADDPIGRLTDPKNPHYNADLAKKIVRIRLPAIAEADDPLGRSPGDPLWPEKYDLDFLTEQKTLDPVGFSALYQQNPSALEGDMFQRSNIRYYDDVPDNLNVYCTSDHAVATGQRNDYTVLLKGGINPAGDLYLLDCFWARAEPDVVVQRMLDMGGRGDHRPICWWAEKGHISKAIGPFLRAAMLETNSFFALQEVTPVGDKVARAQSIAGRIAIGRVYFPRKALWVEDAIKQLLEFPTGTHDDFVDALSLFGLALTRQFGPKERPDVKTAPVYGTLAWLKQGVKRQEPVRYGSFVRRR